MFVKAHRAFCGILKYDGWAPTTRCSRSARYILCYGRIKWEKVLKNVYFFQQTQINNIDLNICTKIIRYLININ
jgi:hypothetical protein